MEKDYRLSSPGIKMKIIMLFISLIIIFISLLIVFIPSFNSKTTYSLSSDEEKQFLQDAQNGSIDAIQKLHYYYHYSLNDNNRSISILKRGASLGNAKFQYELSVHLLREYYPFNTKKTEKDLQEGLFWLKESAKQGYIDAIQDLNNLETDINSSFSLSLPTSSLGVYTNVK